MLKYNSPQYCDQRLNVKNVNMDRKTFMINRYKDKKILHIGCGGGDRYFDDKYNHLHINFINQGMNIDGVDIRKDIIDDMKIKFPNNNFYNSISEIKDEYENEYDVVLLPEVLEHVDNMRLFLDELFSINAKTFFISVPNCEGYKDKFKRIKDNISEEVHPEHYYWFSAYTLFNSVKQYITDMDNTSMFYLQNRWSIAIEINR